MEELKHDLSHRFEAESASRTLALLGEKWTLLILREAFFGVRRFGQLVRNLGIPRPTRRRGSQRQPPRDRARARRAT
jgi:DNA-binding HxlR family transcriptional regulator